MTYVGATPTTGDFKILDSITTSSTTTFNLRQGGVAVYPQSANHCLVVLNGVLQTAGSSFNIVNDTIVFASSLSSSDVINQILVLGNVNDIGVPSDSTVTDAKIVDMAASKLTGTVAQSNIADQAINEAKLQISNAPTNGYMLTAQSGNTGGLTWAEAGSGAMTLLHADESTSAVSEKNYDYFSSTYTNYLITGSVSPANDDVDLWFQWRSGGSAQNASNYINNANYSFVASGSNGTNNRFEYNDDHAELAFRASNNDDKKIDFEVLVFDPMNTAEYTKMLYRSTFASAVSSWVFDYGSSYYNTAHTSAMNGFKILTSAGNIDVRKVYIYGLTKA